MTKNTDAIEPTMHQADAILDFTALSRRDRPDRAYLKIRGANTGEHLFVVRMADLDRVVAQTQEMILRQAKPLAGEPDGPDVQQEMTAAFDIARQAVADWQVIDAPIKSLAMAFAIEIGKAVDKQSGRDAAVKLFEFCAAMIRHMPAPDAAGEHRFPTEH